jgi:arginyl-tRNA synthetase
VIVRSDGTVTYVGKDIALQMWKYGLLDRDFYYHLFEPGLWSTTSDQNADAPEHPSFGRASMVCNVIDTLQAYLQKLLKQSSPRSASKRRRIIRCTIRTRWSR